MPTEIHSHAEEVLAFVELLDIVLCLNIANLISVDEMMVILTINITYCNLYFLVESWFYLLVELTAGRLPWACYTRLEKAKIADSKRKARTSSRKKFLSLCPSQYGLIMDVIDQWTFDDTPDYDLLYVTLARLLDVINVKFEDKYDWEKHDKYRLVPPSSAVADGKPKLFEHCIFVDHEDLQKLVEPVSIQT